MKTKDLVKMGIPAGRCAETAQQILQEGHAAKRSMAAVLGDLGRVAASPAAFLDDAVYAGLARQLVDRAAAGDAFTPRKSDAPYRVWGENHETTAVQQMKNACSLPVAVSGALMPDAHVGYGLPIGGVLATHEAVIPYAVGVDIACRMKLTVLDLPVSALSDDQTRLTRAIERETRFGMGAAFKSRRQHDVMDADWRVTGVTREAEGSRRAQLGTAGAGNHFVEFGQLTVFERNRGTPARRVLRAPEPLGQSGDWCAGRPATTAASRASLHPELPKELSHSRGSISRPRPAGILGGDGAEGQYAAANISPHSRPHRAGVGSRVRLDIENHNNFAWRERHRLPDGSEAEVIVHRKGATPAGAGVLGVIPGSMGTPGYVVRGKGVSASLNSASHGAGRRMSRTKAKEMFTWDIAQKFLRERGVTLLSAGLDEVPMAYKDIEEGMAAQCDLVEPLARFEPRLVKMAPSGEPPED